MNNIVCINCSSTDPEERKKCYVQNCQDNCDKSKKLEELFDRVMKKASVVWRQPVQSTPVAGSGPVDPQGTFFDFVHFRMLRSSKRKYFNLELMKFLHEEI